MWRKCAVGRLWICLALAFGAVLLLGAIGLAVPAWLTPGAEHLGYLFRARA